MAKKRVFGFLFLLLAALLDFFTPYLLGIGYPNFNQFTMVISLFGEEGSPVRTSFLFISVLVGIMYLLALPAIYVTFKATSPLFAALLVSSLGMYAIGDCIFTGLFSVSTLGKTWNFSTWVHNIGSGIGYSGFLLFPFLLFLIYRRAYRGKESLTYLSCFFLSLVFAGAYAAARIPGIRDFWFWQPLGLWQRISYFFSYIPIFLCAITQLFKRKNRI